ncbi:hypothetical protein AB432_018420 [Brevibacillus brevis]|uniref:Uncharacterized protein n=1 Tax=Brevibacillus brevis TaxID=1393 RepID=A0A2Z4MKG7_BREBE|nr:hypothetical protein [Brevibacillus brevis]AWX56899.1 hypothetical protein AB432_018420 [Brevibacillus brevis]
MSEQNFFEGMRNLMHAGASAIFEVLAMYVLGPLLIFSVIAWFIKLRGKVFMLGLVLVILLSLYAFFAYGLWSILEVYNQKVSP